ncbi:MAG: hypothetical protein ACLSBB_07115 [Ruthenibacterium lactatiformans]
MNLWKDRRVDSLHRVVLPREAFSLLGWTSDEVLEAEALPAQDALLLRAQNHPRPQCCACGGAQDLVSWAAGAGCGGLPCRRERRKQSLIFSTRRAKAPRL